MADKIEDFGKKIGGARKDLQNILKTRGIEVNDTVEWTDEEREKYIQKKQIWKEPDFEQLVKDGLPVTVAYYIKHLRDSLPAKPARSKQEYQEGYIRMVADIRDHAMALKTEEECTDFFYRHVRDVYCTQSGFSSYRPTKDAFGCMTTKFLRAATMSTRMLQSEVKKKHFLFSDDDLIDEAYRIIRYDGQNIKLIEDRAVEYKYPRPSAYNPDYMATSYFYRASSYEDTVPLFESMDNWKAGTYFVIVRNSGSSLIAGNLESEEAARAFAKQDFEKRKEDSKSTSTPRKGKFTPQPLEHIERNGMDYRDGKDISGQDMLDSFGFLGGEFGNWENQNDRQYNLNFAYDAFRDLAIALGVDPKDISLGGELSIAFGSRGRGNALAHFEPDRNVINLTKMKGAGSLAHEWGHAFDRFAAKALELRVNYATGAGSYYMSDIDAGFNRLVEAMNWNEDGSQTQYRLASKEMDRKYSRDSMGYWSSNIEMFARAFAVYVQDKLAEKGIRSDYLTGHAESSIYPEGEERKRLNKLFDSVISELKTRGILHAAQNATAAAAPVQEVATSSNSDTEEQTVMQQNSELLNLYQAMTLQKGDVIRLHPMKMLDRNMNPAIVSGTTVIIREITDNTVDYQSFDLVTLQPTYHSVAFMTLNELAKEGFEKIGTAAELIAERQAEEAAANAAEQTEQQQEVTPDDETTAEDEKVATSSNTEPEVTEKEPEMNQNEPEMPPYDTEEGEIMSELPTQYVTPIGAYSDLGAQKLRELSDNPDGYRELLRMTGRIFKIATTVALEFYAQNPEKHYDFISTEAGWLKTGYHLKAGATGITFVDRKGVMQTVYDFNEIVESNEPNIWKVTEENMPIIKAALQIPEETSLINGLMAQYNPDHIVRCLEKLGIPLAQITGEADTENDQIAEEPDSIQAAETQTDNETKDEGLHLTDKQMIDFANSYTNSVHQIIAGRLEIGTDPYNIPVDTEALKLMETDEQRFIVLSYISGTAKELLRKVDAIAYDLHMSDYSERSERNDLRRMEQAEQRAAEQSLGERAAGNSVESVAERTDLQQGSPSERSDGLASDAADESRDNPAVASGNQSAGSDSERKDNNDLPQAESADSSVYTADQRNGADTDRGTGREVRTDMDAVDGGELSGESRMDDASQPVSDGSTVGGTENVGVSRTAGSAIPQDESASDGRLQSDSGVGTGEAVRDRESGDQGRSVSGGYNAVIASAFSSNAVSTHELTFEQQVDAIAAGTSMTGDIQVCATSDILQQVGCRELPMMYTKLHMADALREKSESNPHYHGLTTEQLKQLPEQIAAPAMIFDSISNRVNGNSSIIVILGSTDNDSAPLLMSIKPNGRGRLNGDMVDANFITSIYGKEHDFADYIERIAANNSVLYCDQAKMQSLFAQIGQTVPHSLAALADQTVLHQSRNIANGFGQTFTVHDDINGYQPISTELRAQLMQEFQTKHGLPGSVFVRRDRNFDDGQNTRAYDLRILNGKRFSFRQRIFMVASGEYFSEQKLRDGLAAMEQNPAFKHYLERLANAQRIQERNIRVGDKFRLNMQEVEVTSLEGGLYPDDVVVRSSSQTSTGVNYSVTKNMSKTDLLKGMYLGNPAKDQPELTNEELTAKEMLGNLKDFSLLMSVEDKNNYSDALFDSVIAGRFANMDNPPVTAAFLSVAERFRTNELNYAELAKSLQADGSFVMTGDGIAVSFDRLIEDDGIRFSCRNVNQLATWEDLGRLQLTALYELYISNHEEAARDNPETAAEHAEKIAAATAVMQSYGLISADAAAAAEEEATAASSTGVQDTEAAADEPATVLFDTLSDGTIVARDMEDADPDTNEFPVFAVISVNGTVEFTSPFYSDEQEDAVRARAAEQKAAFTAAWNALSEDEQYNRITTAANEAQFRQIFREESLIADKIAKYAPSIIFGDTEFPLSPDSVIAKWADADRLYFDYDTGTFAWCFYSQDTENFVINRFGLDVLKEAMQYDKPTEIIQERSAQQQTGKTHDSFVETVQSFLNQRADFSIPSHSHGALREIADYLNGYYQQTISQIEIPEYGLSVDLAQIDGIDLITNQLTYEGGIDYDGHERKDNYSEQTLTTHFYMQDGFIWVQEPDFSPSPESNAEMVKTITAFLDRSRTDNDMIVMIRYGGETGNVVYDASAHFVDENETPVEEVATSSNFEQPEAEPEAEQIVKTKDEYLREDLMHGSGFSGGKFRIQEYYLSNTPDNKTFAQFLKGEYGEGGHSGPDMPDVSYGSKGIRIRTEDRTGDYQFTWAQAAREISSMIDSRQYITAENIRDRIADAEYDIRRISLNNPANAAYGDDRVLQRAYEVMRIYGTRFNRLEEDERKFWCEHDWHRPDHSPWGTVEHCTEWGHGIFVVDTDRHGGMMIPERLAEQILTPEAIRIAGEAENGYYCFEEDADMWIPALELFDKGVIEEQDDWRPGFYRLMEESARLHHVDYAEAREAAQNAVIEHALHPDEIRDIYVTLDYEVGEIYYFKTGGMTLSDFKGKFAKYEKPMEAMRQLGQPITLADAAYAEQNQSIYAVTINAYQGTITINDMVNGEAASSSEEPLPESMRPAQPVEETETAAAEEPVPTMTVAEKLQADFDSYVNSLKETGDIMAVVNASAEITAKQNILKYLEAPPEVTEEQRIALVQQDDLLDTVYRRMEEGTAFASQAIASEILVKLAEELAPTPVEPDFVDNEDAMIPETPIEAVSDENELPQDVIPLYRESFTFAKEHDELDHYRASKRENDECSTAITDTSYNHYNDNIFDSDTAYNELCKKFDPDRIALIMANAVIQADWDARYYTDVRRWASETMTRLDMQSPTDDTPRPNLHPGLMNILAQRIIEVEQNIQTQKQEPEEPPVEKVSDIPQEVIDNVLRSGGSHPHSDERIIVGMTAIQDQAGKAAFLRDEFGNSARGIFDGETRYAAVFSEDGIIISQGMRALGNHELHLTWEEAASRTDDLIAVGHFAAAEAVTNASDYMRRTLAEDIVSYYRDFARNYFIESRYFAATEKRSVDLLELYLKDTDFCKAALDRLHADDRSEQAEIFLIRMETALVLSADSENTPYDASVQFVTDPDFDPAIRQFISDDDKMLLMTEIAERGDLDAFYAESHTMQEKEAFLKRHFVLSTEAADGRIVEYGGLGIGISKIDKNHVQLAKATVSWKEAAELLEVPMAMRTAQHDSLTVTGSAVEHRNAQIISNLKEGDRFGFGDKTYKITKINGDFMCSMDRINNDGTRFEGTGEAGHQLIGNWKESLLQLAGQNPIIVDEPVAQTFRIYQMKPDERFHYQRFESYESLQKQNFPVDYKNYDHVYAGTTPPNTTLDDIYREFNLDRPADFMGHSLSVGDIIVLENGGTLSGTHENAFFVDSVGFMPVPEFVTSREVLRTALQSIEEFSNNEYGTPADTSDLEHIDLAYTTTENGLHEVQIYANIMDCTIVHTIDGEVDDTEQYTDLNDMNRRALRVMTYDTLISDTLFAAEDDIPDDENTPEETAPVTPAEEVPQRSYDPKTMRKQIKSLDSTEDFYEKVRDIIGYYDGVTLSVHVIKSLQAVADERYEQLTAQEKQQTDLDTLKVGDHVRYDGKEWAVEKIDGDFSISLQNLDATDNMQKLGSTHWKTKLEGLEKIDGFGIPNHSAPKPVKEHGRVQTEGQLNLFDFNNTTAQEQEAETAENSADTAAEQTKAVSPEPIEEVAASSNSGDTAEPDAETSAEEATETAQTEPANEEPQEAAPQQPVGTRIQKQLYQAFAEKFPEMLSGEHIYERYGSLNDLEDDGNGVEPLSIKSLGDNQFGMMMYYEQNGDLMRDPDYVFEVDPETKTIQALEYQQDGVPSVGTLYQTVLRNDGTTDMHLQAAIEKSLLQTIRHIDDFDRPLTRYIDSEGEEHDLIDEDTTEAIEEAPASTDKSAYLREVLNEFSEKHGFGELNLVAGRDNVYDLEETFADGETMTLGWLHGEYYSPFTPETLRNSLAELEISCQRRNEDITDLRGRKYNVQLHGGISPLPEVPDNLTEIHYAEEPGMKIRANLSAIREIQRLERCEEAGTSLYEKWVKDYNSKENSDRRLREYSGWGGLSQIFDESFGNLASYRAELQKLLSPEEYTAARASTLTAHYTPQVVIDAMYKAIKQMDLPRDSRILEPSCGTGNFITRMPHSIGNAGIVGVELDSITAKIAKYLATGRDNVTIKNCGFENSGLEDNSFDLVIGNVPFGDYKLIDPDHAKDWLIHDAFFRKALDKVAPGGVVAFITSTGTLDKKNPRVREYLATQANLIGAIRLPNNTFSAAGTNASSDIIFLQKREHPLNALDPKPDWCYTSKVTVEKVGKVKEGEQPEKVQAFINNYFVRNPQMVLGTIKQTTHFDMLTVEPIKDADLEKQLDRAVHNLHGKIAAQRSRKQEMLRQNGIEPWGKDYQFQVQDDKVYYRQGDTMRKIKDNKKGHISTDAIKMLIPLRDTTRELLERQQSRLTDEALLPLRERMTELYDAYVAKFGNINDQIAKSSFGDDADYAILCALEDKVDDKYVKAAIFTERTVNPYQEVTSAASVESALQISLDQRGRIDIPYMATLLNSYYQEQGIDQEAAMQLIAQDLIENELVFSDPEKQTADDPFASYVERADYLSGEVRRKLVMAESMAQINPEYQRNVDALRDVIPVDIPASEISVTMGAPWIEPEDYTEFLRHLSERPRYSSLRMEVHYSDVTGEYTIPNANSKKNDLNTAETTTYGTPDYNMYALALRILNQRRIEVKVQVPDPKDPSKTIARTDPKATKLANEKAKEIKKEFEKWLFADPARKEKYEAKYNQLFNSLVPRKYDGSRLTFNGMRAGFELKPHQLNCVARTVYGGNTLAAHVVGAGKSAVIAASVMKKKELGLIHKAILVVPKPLTEQSAREWRSVFPDAKLLVVSAADLANEQNREIFTAKVATGDYDCVIVSKEQFQKLGMSPEYQVEFLNKERDELLDQLAERKKENSRDYTIKEIEKKVKDLETRIQKIMNPQSKAAAKDTLMNFETLGFDYLVVDEAHNYKNGFVTTKMSNVSGVTTKASGIAQDMQMKCDYFNQQYGDGHILFATGTPYASPYQH